MGILDWQVDGEAGTLPWAGFQFDFSTHMFRQLFDQCQPQTRTAVFSGQEDVKLLEFFKYGFEIFGRNARPGAATEAHRAASEE